MGFFADIKISTKLGVAFGSVVVLTAVVGLSGIRQINTLDAQNNSLYHGSMIRTNLLGDVVSHAKQVRILDFRMMDTPVAGQKAVDDLTDVEIKKVDDILAEYGSKAFIAEDKTKLSKLQEDWKTYAKEREQFRSMLRTSREKASAYFVGAMLTDFNDLLASLDNLSTWNENYAEKQVQSGDKMAAAARTQMLAIIFLGICVAVGAGLVVSRRIRAGVHDLQDRLTKVADHCVKGLADAANAMASGDLTVVPTASTTPIVITSKDELGQASMTFNRLLESTQTAIADFATAQSNLRDLIKAVAVNADSVASTSSELSESASQTSQASADIANTIQNVAAASDQSAHSSQEIAKGSEDLARTSESAAVSVQRLDDAIESVKLLTTQQKETAGLAATVAKDGGDAVDRTVKSMGRIRHQVEESTEVVRRLGEQGQQIGAIVQTIEAIAEQTNLLALNAAIEAARAGEHGRGFAVVADEVRKLAEQASSSTREISSLIEGVRANVDEVVKAMDVTSSQVSEGAHESEGAGKALLQILETIGLVQSACLETEKAVGSMASNASEVSVAITQVASVSQETAAGAEELSATSEEVSASAQNVSAAVEEQTASIDEVSAAAQQLSAMSAELKTQLGKFKYESDGAMRVVQGSQRKAA